MIEKIKQFVVANKQLVLKGLVVLALFWGGFALGHSCADAPAVEFVECVE